MNVGELSGARLDKWVAIAEGFGSAVMIREYGAQVAACLFSSRVMRSGDVVHRPGDFWEPSVDWRQGGPLIARERINIIESMGSWPCSWLAFKHEVGINWVGSDPLVAAMRAYVASKFGFDVPDEVRA